MAYVCAELKQIDNVMVCTNWVIYEYSSYKLTNEQMAEFIYSIAVLFATVAVIKLVKRSFF